MTTALGHLKVLDLSRVLAGPWATQTLGDLGAEIWKIERPGTGDETRGWGPPYIVEPTEADPGISAYFAGANRNKKSLAVDFTSAEGADLICRLASRADIVIENFKVGGLAKYGLDYESLSAVAPHLIYCSLTGFGQTGPDAERPGYDFMIQGMSGLMSVTGQPDGTPGAMPVKAGVALIDILTGLNANIAMLAAVEHRNRTGQGQHIDMALFDVGVSSLANQALNFLATGLSPVRMGNAHPNIVPYQAFASSDGFIILAVGNDGQFQRFCHEAGKSAWLADPRFKTNALRVQNRDALIALLEPVMAERTTDEWLDALAAIAVPAGPVNDLERVFAEPQARHRGLIKPVVSDCDITHPSVASPLGLSKTPPQYISGAPRLGAHTNEVLRSELALTPEEIDHLVKAGIIEDRG